MLVTFRNPVADLRGFCADRQFAESVRLPTVWSEGEFLRQFGPVVPRPSRRGGAIGERAFVDFRRNLSFRPGAAASLARTLEPLVVQGIDRRVWPGLSDANCLFNFDVSLRIDFPRDKPWTGIREDSIRLSDLGRIASAFGEQLVNVGGVGRTWDYRPTVPLRSASRFIAGHFADATTSAQEHRRGLVLPVGGCIAIEAIGVAPKLDVADQIDIFRYRNVEVLRTSAMEGWRRRTAFVISSGDRDQETRQLVRDLRVHLLRLHAVCQFVSRLTSVIVQYRPAGHPPNICDNPKHEEFQKLQLAMTSALKVMRGRDAIDEPDGLSMLSLAQGAYEVLSDYSLHNLETRVLGKLDGALADEFRQFARDEEDRVRADRVIESTRDRAGVVHIYGKGSTVGNYDMRDQTFGQRATARKRPTSPSPRMSLRSLLGRVN